LALHRLTGVTVGVPDVPATKAFYEDFGLVTTGVDQLGTSLAGGQITFVAESRRRFLGLGVGADSVDDIDRAAGNLDRLGVAYTRRADRVRAALPGTEAVAVLEVAERVTGDAQTAAITTTNGPWRHDRPNGRAPGVVARGDRVVPCRLGHAAVASTDAEATIQFLVEGLGFAITDRLTGVGAFVRCSEDHHNVLVMGSPRTYLHHTAWEVRDIDEVGRGGTAMLRRHPDAHLWGLGRHFLGSQIFWYLRDPAGNYAEYYSDGDVITDPAQWEIGDWGGDAVELWGPAVPPAFFEPVDMIADKEDAGRDNGAAPDP
jgi:catechol 2,3-dioxygenase-like lactoylglutathione lyase family enzyme